MDVANCIKAFSATLAAKHYNSRIAPLFDAKNRNIGTSFLNSIAFHDWVEIESLMRKDQKAIDILYSYKYSGPCFVGNIVGLLLCEYDQCKGVSNHETIIDAFDILIKLI
jgi:hypothetical protein